MPDPDAKYAPAADALGAWSLSTGVHVFGVELAPPWMFWCLGLFLMVRSNHLRDIFLKGHRKLHRRCVSRSRLGLP